MGLNAELIWIFGGIAAGALIIMSAVLFFVSRRSQRVMESLLQLLIQPERIKIEEASRVVKTVMNDEVLLIEASFAKMTATLESHISAARALETQVGTQNKELVALADAAVRGITTQTRDLEKQLKGFASVLESKQWRSVSESAEKFQNKINTLLTNIENTVRTVTSETTVLQNHIDGWIESGRALSAQLQSDIENNTGNMNALTAETNGMRDSLDTLGASVRDGFANVKAESAGYEKTMTANEKLLARQLEKMDAFTKQSKTLLVSQMNGLTSTANVVGGQIRLAESSIEKQGRVLAEAITKLMEAAETTESFVRNISGEVAVLAGKFRGEIREFATGVVGELNTVYTVANTTLNDTKSAAGSFSESVRVMADGVRETISEMNAAHSTLTAQSGQLVRVSAETTDHLKPLSELIEKYYAALPDLTRESAAMSERMKNDVGALDEKFRGLNDAARDALVNIADSSLKLEHLSGQSRQQMIDLLSDYARAVDTMQTLNKQMIEAHVAAPMNAVAKTPSVTAIGVTPQLTSAEFIKESERLIEKMHELSVDLTRSVGAEIPDTIWHKYHNGDRTIFSKWFAKMLSAADKRRVKNMFKSDAVFRSQTTQFVRSFSKLLSGAEHTDDPESLTATLLKTDLGQMYMVLKSFM